MSDLSENTTHFRTGVEFFRWIRRFYETGLEEIKMRRSATCIISVLIAAVPARADEAAVANLGDALAYMIACPGRLYYDRNVMTAYAEQHKLEWEEGTAGFERVKARSLKTLNLLLTRPQSEVCVEGNRYYGTLGTKAARFLTWW